MSETMELISGGVLFATLGMVSLLIIGITRGMASLILGFIVVTLIISMIFGVKYIFLNALFFGLAAMSYTGVVLFRRVSRCSKELQEAIEQEKREKEERK